MKNPVDVDRSMEASPDVNNGDLLPACAVVYKKVGLRIRIKSISNGTFGTNYMSTNYNYIKNDT